MAMNLKLKNVLKDLERGSPQKDFVDWFLPTMTRRIKPRYPVSVSMYPMANAVEDSYPERTYLFMTLSWADDTGRTLNVQIALHRMTVHVTVIESDDRSWDYNEPTRNFSEVPENEFYFHCDPRFNTYRPARGDDAAEEGSDMDKMVVYIQTILVNWRNTKDDRRP